MEERGVSNLTHLQISKILKTPAFSPTCQYDHRKLISPTIIRGAASNSAAASSYCPPRSSRSSRIQRLIQIHNLEVSLAVSSPEITQVSKTAHLTADRSSNVRLFMLLIVAFMEARRLNSYRRAAAKGQMERENLGHGEYLCGPLASAKLAT
jgi:hypothetical protein